jgi:asparagine synthetase B (glutamine-hydrolysing)
MCSIFFSTKRQGDLEAINRLIKYRGPDSSNYDFRNGTFFIHNLLSITGTVTQQPLFDENSDVGVVFNGEIYNYKAFGPYDNDSKCIIPLYKQHGINFVTGLDGEFAIVLVDYKIKKVIISTDVFGTKPLFLSTTDGICVSTYKSAVVSNGFKNVEKIPANTVLLLDLETGKIERKFKLHNFDLKQHKTSPVDWFKAFARSIKKRAVDDVREKTFIGLSSGYDSGAIACELMKQNAKFTTYTMIGRENMDVLNKRLDLVKNNANVEHKIWNISEKDRSIAHQYLLDNTEDWKYTIHSKRSDYNEYHLSLWDDNGSNSLSHLCSMAKNDGKKILLSGAGADEIFSDYGYNGESKYQHSNFGGLFPQDLKSIFPWPSFFGSSMESYIMKDEVVGGSYGLEVRYPFLDKEVVQEFLWLTAEYKNSKYKSVLHDYLAGNKFPFAPNEKIGF